MTTEASRSAVEAVWRIESGRLIAGLTRVVGDVGLAEDVAQDALVAALEQWPQRGTPDNPGAWLMTTAKRRAIDRFRREARLAAKYADLARRLEAEAADVGSAADAALDDAIGDDLLSLMFVACHPVLSPEARTALTLKMVGGLSTTEIARAFLVKESTVAQRVVRAKRTLADAGVPFEVPEGADLEQRLPSVLEVIYLVFNEGYAATSGDDVLRPALCQEAMRLGRVLARLAPSESEVHALVALMELQASRIRARVGPAGEPVLLLDQNRAQWDQLLIGRGLAALEQAAASAQAASAEAALSARRPGSYLLQAQIAACHARAHRAQDTDWPRIAALYDELLDLTGSPVVALNRAVAHGMADGPDRGLVLVDELVDRSALSNYHLLHTVRGDLLAKLGRRQSARAEFERAAALTQNARERAVLLARAAACDEAVCEE